MAQQALILEEVHKQFSQMVTMKTSEQETVNVLKAIHFQLQQLVSMPREEAKTHLQ